MSLSPLRRLTYWLTGGPDPNSPPSVPPLPQFTPLLDHVTFPLYLKGKLDPMWTKEQIIDYVNSSITDSQIQAHVIAHLRDRHGLHFDPKLNKHIPEPRYWGPRERTSSTAYTVTTDGSAALFNDHL